VLPVMEKQKAGSIVNVASSSGIRFTGNAQVGYAAIRRRLRTDAGVAFAQIAAVPIPLYLAFDEATYYEGAVLVVDGGRTGARQRARGSAALSRIAAFERWRPGRP
jgi:NAD(P)-dependent dehydrogenase (short-subunit alcohol dehydrogenase family)